MNITIDVNKKEKNQQLLKQELVSGYFGGKGFARIYLLLGNPSIAVQTESNTYLVPIPELVKLIMEAEQHETTD